MVLLYKVRDKRRFLMVVLERLTGSASVSFEGDLGRTALLEVYGASGEETQILKRNTIWPRQDFVVLPLESATVGTIMKAVGGTMPKSILHIQVEKDGRLELGMYDSFAPRAMFFGPTISGLIESLIKEDILSPWIER